MSKETEAAITNPFYCGNNGELYYAHEDKQNRLAASKPDELSKQQKTGQLNMHSVRRSAAIKWWNSLTFEHKFYKVIEWLKNQNRDTTERHPNSLTGSEIEEIHRHCA